MTHDVRSLSARLLAASPLAMSIDEARAQTAARRRELLAAPATQRATSMPEAEFAPTAMPDIHTPIDFSNAFHAKREPGRKQPPKPKAKKRPLGRKPIGELDDRHNRFTVVDGDKPDGDNPPPTKSPPKR